MHAELAPPTDTPNQHDHDPDRPPGREAPPVSTSDTPAALPYLHVYAPRKAHDEGLLMGTRAGLMALAAALEARLQGVPDDHAVALCTNGGEGYTLRVRLVGEASMAHVAPPYAASGSRDDA